MQLLRNQFATNFDQKHVITVFTKKGISNELLSETNHMKMTGEIIYLEYTVSEVYTHLPTVFDIRQFNNIVNRSSYDITIDVRKLVILNSGLKRMFKDLLKVHHQTSKPLRMPCTKIKFKLGSVHITSCPDVTVTLAFLNGVMTAETNLWNPCQVKKRL